MKYIACIGSSRAIVQEYNLPEGKKFVHLMLISSVTRVVERLACSDYGLMMVIIS